MFVQRWRWIASPSLLFLLLVVWVAPVRGTPPSWRFANPKPHGNNIIDMALHGDIVWQAGDRGSVYTSPDLDNWFPRESGTTQSLRAITFMGTNAFISGSSGTIVSGPNPWSLNPASLGTSDWLEGIAASTNRVVAVGDNGAIYTSEDGANWSRINKFTTWLRSVAYGLGNFVCVGETGFLAVSADGENWNKKSLSTTENLNRVSFLQGIFWVVGDNGTVLTNDDSMNFQTVDVGFTNALFAVAASTNEVVVVGDSTVLLWNSTNTVWTSQADASDVTKAPLWPYYSALWDGRLFLLGGRNGMKVEGYRTNTTDPLVWYSDVQPSRNWLWNLAHVPNLYTAVGESGTIVTSADGYDWAREFVPTNYNGEIFLGVGGTTNSLVAVGTAGTILYSPNVYTNVIGTNSVGETITNRTSLLGIVWNPANNSTVAEDLQGICAAGNGFIATGSNGTILTSPDGLNWVSQISPVTTYLSSVTPFPDGYVAVGDRGTTLLSPNGLLWTEHNAGVTNWIYSVRYLNSTLLAVGEGGLIMTSTNGINWRRQTSGTTVWLNDSAFANNTWYVAANSGLVLSSTDAFRWTIVSSATSRSLNSIAADGDQLVVAGADGMILRSNFSVATTPVRFGSYSKNLSLSTFLFEGVPDQRFALEQKTNIEDPWEVFAVLELLDSSGTLLLQREEGPIDSKFFQTRLVE
jgi:hypothetical protein